MAGKILGSRRNGSVGVGIYIVGSIGLACLALAVRYLPHGARRLDFNVYYACAVALRRGMDPYAIDLRLFTRQLNLSPALFSYPADTPTFILATEPLAFFSVYTAYAIWTLASLLCVGASLFMLFGPSARLGRGTALLFSLGALGFTPLVLNLSLSQSQTFLMFGVMLFYRMLQRGRDRWAGALLAILGLLRGFPFALGGHLLAHRKWPAIVFSAITFGAGVALTVMLLGWDVVEHFLRMIGIVGGNEWLSLKPSSEIAGFNVSLNAFVDRPLMLLFGLYLSPTARMIHRAIIVMADIAILAATLRATAAASIERSLSLWIATMLIISPLVWLYYLMLLIIPFGLIAVAAVHGQTSAHVWRLAVRSYCLIVLTTPILAVLTFGVPRFIWSLAAFNELGFLGLLISWIATYRFATEPLGSSQPEGQPEAPRHS